MSCKHLVMFCFIGSAFKGQYNLGNFSSSKHISGTNILNTTESTSSKNGLVFGLTYPSC